MPIQWQDLVKDIREDHVRVPGASGDGRCLSCQKVWPCHAIRAAATIEYLSLGHETLIQWAAGPSALIKHTPDPSPADWQKASAVLKAAGLRLSVFSNSTIRHIAGRAAEISTEALKLKAGA